MIADGLLDTVGLDPQIHRPMGLYLMFSSAYTLYMIYTGKYDRSKYAQFYINYVTPFSLFIIALGVSIKVYKSFSHN